MESTLKSFSSRRRLKRSMKEDNTDQDKKMDTEKEENISTQVEANGQDTSQLETTFSKEVMANVNNAASLDSVSSSVETK